MQNHSEQWAIEQIAQFLGAQFLVCILTTYPYIGGSNNLRCLADVFLNLFICMVCMNSSMYLCVHVSICPTVRCGLIECTKVHSICG